MFYRIIHLYIEAKCANENSRLNHSKNKLIQYGNVWIQLYLLTFEA
jgi:hypothetical protein